MFDQVINHKLKILKYSKKQTCFDTYSIDIYIYVFVTNSDEPLWKIHEPTRHLLTPANPETGHPETRNFSLVERCTRLIINGAQAAQMLGSPNGWPGWIETNEDVFCKNKIYGKRWTIRERKIYPETTNN